MTGPFEDLSLEALRERRSQKWAAYPTDVLPAWVAEMDFPLAPVVAEALHHAIDLGDCGYAHPGTLREAFAGFAAERWDWAIAPELVSLAPDVVVGIAEVLNVVTKPGDGIVINPPVYPPFRSTIEGVGRRIVEAPLAETDGRWALDLDALEAAFAAGAAAYLLCSPHNPTGEVFTRAALEAIAALAERYDVLVISDEIHAPMALAGSSHIPFPAVSEAAAERSVVVTSASKAWNLAGLKSAVIVAGSPAVRARLDAGLPAHLDVHSGHLGVIASAAAFASGGEWLDELVHHLGRQHALLAELLADELPGVGFVPPQAGYLCWLDCRSLGLGDDPADAFLEQGLVALTSGLGFGTEGKGWARLNVGTSSELLREAVRRMASTLD